MDDFKKDLQNLNVSSFQAGELASLTAQNPQDARLCFFCVNCFFNCFHCHNCFNCHNCHNCQNCHNCMNCHNCQTCHHCR